jgi:hypothetical protein
MYNAGLQGRIEYSDTIRAKSYFDAIHEISKPSPWYDDDPIGDANSLYLKRLLALVEIAADVIENSNDRQLIDTAEVGMVRSFFDYLPNTAKWWLNKRLNDFLNSLLAAYRPAEIMAQLVSANMEFLQIEIVSDRHFIVFGSIS